MRKLFIIFSLLIFGFVCFAEMRYTKYMDSEMPGITHNLAWVVNNNWRDEYGFVKKYWRITDIAYYDKKPYVRNEEKEYKLINQLKVTTRALEDDIILAILEETGYVYDYMINTDGSWYNIVEYFMVDMFDVYARSWSYVD